MSTLLEQINEKETIIVEQDAAQVVRHLAHELRQPLSALESLAYYLDILLSPGDVRARQQIEKIQSLVEQTNWIIDDAVHYTQASAPNPVPLALDELITQALADRGRGPKLNVHLELASGRCYTYLDPQQGRHLLASLLGFFRQIALPDTPVHVATECCGPMVGLRIACQSPTPAAELREMFEPCNGCVPSGQGLALASAKRIIEAHSGEMKIAEAGYQRIALTLRFAAAR